MGRPERWSTEYAHHRRHRRKHVVLGIVLGVVGAVGLDLGLLAWHDLQDVLGSGAITRVETARGVGRGPTPGLDGAAPAPPTDPRFNELESLLTFTPLSRGNSVELLPTGAATFPRLWADLRAARWTITVEQYYCGPGRVADSLRAALTERARAGVRVLFLWDGFGCKNLGDDYFASLRRAGVDAVPFRPLHWYSLHRGQHRSHLRVVIVDGRVGWVGGAGFDDKWWTGSKGDPPWRDTNARFTGPAVGTLQAAFATGWAEATGRVLAGPAFFGEADSVSAAATASATTGAAAGSGAATGSAATVGSGAANGGGGDSTGAGAAGGGLAGVLFSVPAVGVTPAERFLALTTDAVRRRLYISNPYFLPSEGLRAVLAQAARRGADVRVLTAGDRIDVPILRDAARSYYRELLRAGVRIYEYQPAMMHAKTLVADGTWSTIGTLNFDERSLRLNDEATLLVSDPGTAAALEELFATDLRSSREIRIADLDRESWVTHAWEKVCRLLTPFL